VDHVLPELTPYETSVYLYLLRNSHLKSGANEVRVGKRTIAQGYGRGSKGEKTNYEHISEVLRRLEQKECIKVGDTNREGTLYVVRLPKDIPFVASRIASLTPVATEEDFFTDPDKRRVIFKRDAWICQYCGERVNPTNATIDHFVPQVAGGKHNKDNLKAACLVCNSIKSGKTYEEAMPLLLKSIQERRARVNKSTEQPG
jgi:5-methylcytosine-specific restriction endonuclease McrA